MNENKLNQLYGAVRKEIPPSPEPGFENLVLSAIRREQSARGPETVSVFDQLGALFPRLAWAAVLVVALGVGVDFGLGALGVPGLTDGVAQAADQWLFTTTGF